MKRSVRLDKLSSRQSLHTRHRKANLKLHNGKSHLKNRRKSKHQVQKARVHAKFEANDERMRKHGEKSSKRHLKDYKFSNSINHKTRRKRKSKTTIVTTNATIQKPIIGTAVNYTDDETTVSNPTTKRKCENCTMNNNVQMMYDYEDTTAGKTARDKTTICRTCTTTLSISPVTTFTSQSDKNTSEILFNVSGVTPVSPLVLQTSTPYVGPYFVYSQQPTKSTFSLGNLSSFNNQIYRENSRMNFGLPKDSALDIPLNVFPLNFDNFKSLDKMQGTYPVNEATEGVDKAISPLLKFDKRSLQSSAARPKTIKWRRARDLGSDDYFLTREEEQGNADQELWYDYELENGINERSQRSLLSLGARPRFSRALRERHRKRKHSKHQAKAKSTIEKSSSNNQETVESLDEDAALADRVLRNINKRNEHKKMCRRKPKTLIDKVKHAFGNAMDRLNMPQVKEFILPEKQAESSTNQPQEKFVPQNTYHEPPVNYRRNDHHNRPHHSKTPPKKVQHHSENTDKRISKAVLHKSHAAKANHHQPEKAIHKNTLAKHAPKNNPIKFPDIVPAVKKLVQDNHLQNVEKIIVYVDKKGELAGHKSPGQSLKRDDSVKGHSSNRRSNIQSSKYDLVKHNNKASLTDTGKISFDGETLDSIISGVADKVLKSLDAAPKSPGDADPRLKVKIIQSPLRGSKTPYKKIETEFLLDVSSVRRTRADAKSTGLNKVSENKQLVASKDVHGQKKESRLTGARGERKMNLANDLLKNRRHWHNKVEKHHKVSLSSDDRSKRSVDSDGNSQIDKSSSINERIKILYNMRHKGPAEEFKHLLKKSAPKNHESIKHNKNKRAKSHSIDKRESGSEDDDFYNESEIDNKNIYSNNLVDEQSENDMSSHGVSREFMDVMDESQLLNDDVMFYNHISDLINKWKSRMDKSQLANVTQVAVKENDSNLDVQKVISNLVRVATELSRQQNVNVQKRSADLCSQLSTEDYKKLKSVLHGGMHLLLRRSFDCKAGCHRGNETIIYKPMNNQVDLPRASQEPLESLKKQSSAKLTRSVKDEDYFDSDDQVDIDEHISSEDKKSLRSLKSQISSIRKHINTTLSIISNKLQKSNHQMTFSPPLANHNQRNDAKSNAWIVEQLRGILDRIIKEAEVPSTSNQQAKRSDKTKRSSKTSENQKGGKAEKKLAVKITQKDSAKVKKSSSAKQKSKKAVKQSNKGKSKVSRSAKKGDKKVKKGASKKRNDSSKSKDFKGVRLARSINSDNKGVNIFQNSTSDVSSSTLSDLEALFSGRKSNELLGEEASTEDLLQLFGFLPKPPKRSESFNFTRYLSQNSKNNTESIFNNSSNNFFLDAIKNSSSPREDVYPFTDNSFNNQNRRFGRHLCYAKSSEDKSVKKKKEISKAKGAGTIKGSVKQTKRKEKISSKVQKTSESRKPKRSDSSKHSTNNCENCICDMEDAIVQMRKLLQKKNNLLGRIKDFECTRFNDIGKAIVISSDTDDDTTTFFMRSRRDFDDDRGQKLVRAEDLEGALTSHMIIGRGMQVVSLLQHFCSIQRN